MSLATTVAAQRPPGGMRIGTVTATSPLTVQIQGGPVATPGRLASYTPGVGDVVALVRQRSTWLVLGEVLPG